MVEKYKRIFALEENLYCRNSPVIISSGVLLQDSENGQLFAQLKFQSVSITAIRGLSVELMAFDATGTELARLDKHFYMDHSVINGHYFDENFFIQIPSPQVQSFSINNLSVVLVDDSVVETGGTWKKLPEPSWINDILLREDLIKQYRLEANIDAIYAPQMSEGLWQCSCGQWDVNVYGGYAPCSACGADKAVVFGAFSTKYLEESISRREAKEANRQKVCPNVDTSSLVTLPIWNSWYVLQTP